MRSLRRLRRALELRELAREQSRRIRLEPRRHLLGEQPHALAGERVRHVAHVKLDQQMAGLGVLDEVAPRLKADSAQLFARQFPELERTPELAQ